MHLLLKASQEFNNANGVLHAAAHILHQGFLYSFIALKLHTHDSIDHKRGEEVYLHSFLTLQTKVRSQFHAPATLTPTSTEHCVAAEAVNGSCQKKKMKTLYT